MGLIITQALALKVWSQENSAIHYKPFSPAYLSGKNELALGQTSQGIEHLSHFIDAQKNVFTFKQLFAQFGKTKDLAPRLIDTYLLADALLERSNAHLLQGRRESAKSDLDRALLLYPNYGKALCSKATFLSSLGKTAESSQVLKAAESSELSTYDFLLASAELLEAAGGKAEAEEKRRLAYETIRQENRQSKSSMSLLVMHRIACDFFSYCIKLSPQSAHLYSCRAKYLFGLGENRRALRDIDKAISLSPNNLNYHRSKVKTLLRLKENERAEQELAVLKKLGGGSPVAESEYFQLLALLESSNGRSDKAAEAFTRASRLLPSDLSLRQSLIRFLIKNGNFSQAESETRAWLATGREKAEAKIVLANVLIGQKDLNQALTLANEMISSAPNQASGYRIRAKIMQLKGRTAESERDYQTALKFSPQGSASRTGTEREILVSQTENEIRAGNYEDGQYELRFAEQAVPSLVNADRELSKIDLQNAEKRIGQMLVLFPARAEAYYDRGMLRASLDSQVQSLSDFERFIFLSKDFGKAKENALAMRYLLYWQINHQMPAEKLLWQGCKGSDKLKQSALLQYISGRVETATLLSHQKSIDDLTRATCFVGIREFLQGKKEASKQHLSWVVRNGNSSMDEYTLAYFSYREWFKS